MRKIRDEPSQLYHGSTTPEPATAARNCRPLIDLVRQVARAGGLPVVLFCAGDRDPARRRRPTNRQLGAEGVFVGSGVSVSTTLLRAAAIVEATTHFQDPERVAAASEGLGTAMVSLETRKLEEQQLLANRGW